MNTLENTFTSYSDEYTFTYRFRELKKFLVLMKMPVSDSAVEKIMCESDANKDDQVNLRGKADKSEPFEASFANRRNHKISQVNHRTFNSLPDNKILALSK